MKKKILRWLIGIFCLLLLLAVGGILLLDTIAKSVAERRVRAETGMETKIGKFNVGLKTSTIHIEDFVLKNPAEFGGDTFVEIPELFFDYDRDALREGKLHLKLVRIEIANIHVVENKDGKRNVDELQKHERKPEATGQSTPKPTGGSTNQIEQPFAFDGIDLLEVTLKTAQFTSAKDKNQNFKKDLGIRHETFRNLKTEKDFQTAAALIALKVGGGLLWSGEMSNPLSLLLGGSTAGKETKNVLEGLAEPLPKTKQP